MPALRVVGFQPSLLRVSTLASAAQKAANMEGLEYPRLSSPLSQLLMADRRQNSDCSSGSSLFGAGDSHHGEHSGGEGRCSNTGSSFDSIMNTTDSTMSADGMQPTEKNLEGFEEGFVAAAPIDIPYNAHGVRHWRRCVREKTHENYLSPCTVNVPAHGLLSKIVFIFIFFVDPEDVFACLPS